MMCTFYRHSVLHTSEHLQQTDDSGQRMLRTNIDVRAQLLSRHDFQSSRSVSQQWDGGGGVIWFLILRYRPVREGFQFIITFRRTPVFDITGLRDILSGTAR